MDGRELDAALLALAKRQHGVVGREQALLLGATREQLRHRVARGWIRWLPNVLRAPWAPSDFHARASAALLWAGRGALLSHHSSAHVWGLVPPRLRIEVSVSRRLIPPAPWLTVHRVPAFPLELARRARGGWAVTSPARTLIDLAGPVEDIEPLAEAALRGKLLTPTELEQVFEQLAARGRWGIASFRRFLSVRLPDAERLESALEHRALKLFSRARLPRPVCQHRIQLPSGAVRVDFAWPAARVVVEADGHAHHSGRADWNRDLKRHNALLHAGWRALRLTWEDTKQEAPTLLDQLRALLAPN